MGIKKEDSLRINIDKCEFLVGRINFVSDEIFNLEKEKIFSKCWLYVGHDSELEKAGDFVTRQVGGRSVIFVKDRDCKIRALLNTCPHRGAQVCREKSGTAKSFQCFYHGWVFSNSGKLVGLPGDDSYTDGFIDNPEKSLTPVPLHSAYRGFHFICFDKGAISLSDYLGNAKEYLDLVVDQAEFGAEIVGGTQEYAIDANWKLLAENSYDGYHAPTNHSTYFDYLKNTTGGLNGSELKGVGIDLGNGHGVIEYTAPFGRPVASWIEAWGEEGKVRIDKIYARLVERFGEERASRIAKFNRNIHIFPNLVVNDIMALTIRTFYPLAPNHMHVNAWSLAPVGEDEADRKERMFNFLEFLGPGGFATPDDIEALENCQLGFRNMLEAQWNDVSRGMNKEESSTDDEEQMRGYWKEWSRRMFDA